MNGWPIAGFTSTGSKRPEALFGPPTPDRWQPPARMVSAAGCRVRDEAGREYLDYIMALGAVALGYGHPEVVRAATAAAESGGVGPLPPVLEEELAAELRRVMPWLEQMRFLKTGAEACAAAVRLARTATGRELVLGCGYHGWLDWCQTAEGRGVPASTRLLYGEVPFNDPERTRERIRAAGDHLAAVVFEPVILEAPAPEWIAVLRDETLRVGAILVADEIKTVCRLAVGGGCERYGIRPDLVVMGKAIANGLPLAAVGGRADVDEILEVPPVSLETREGFETAVFAYTTDIPLLDHWGTPLLLGPGSIHVAHTDHEHVRVDELLTAVDLYEQLALRLLEENG